MAEDKYDGPPIGSEEAARIYTKSDLVRMRDEEQHKAGLASTDEELDRRAGVMADINRALKSGAYASEPGFWQKFLDRARGYMTPDRADFEEQLAEMTLRPGIESVDSTYHWRAFDPRVEGMAFEPISDERELDAWRQKADFDERKRSEIHARKRERDPAYTETGVSVGFKKVGHGEPSRMALFLTEGYNGPAKQEWVLDEEEVDGYREGYFGLRNSDAKDKPDEAYFRLRVPLNRGNISGLLATRMSRVSTAPEPVEAD